MDLILPQVGINLFFMTQKNIFTSLEQPSHIFKKNSHFHMHIKYTEKNLQACLDVIRLFHSDFQQK